MTLLDSAIGLLVLAVPLLAAVITLLIVLVETIYLNRYTQRFWLTFKKVLLANFLSALAGLVIVLALNISGSLGSLEETMGITLRLKDGAGGYAGRILLIIILYFITILIEVPLLRKLFKSFAEVTTRRILVANAISYFLLGIWFLFQY